MKNINSTIWEHKYAPQKIEDVVLPNEMKLYFQKMIEEKDIPTLLFYGSAGHGKTATAYAIVNELDADYLYINGSLATSIDVLRDKVMQFASTNSIMNGKKIVIIDECLEENEIIRTGTLDNRTFTKLKDFEIGKEYDIISFNTETCLEENDKGEIISDRYDEVFEIELEDGRTIITNKNHPFFIKNGNGVIDIKMSELEEGMSIISI